MSTNQQRFQSFITRVRPHRVAVLTNNADPHWQDSCLGIIEFFTKLWGGTHCIIVPTNGLTIDESFWSVLSSYDPDVIYRYQRTGEDERLRAPELFAKLVASRVAQYALDTGIEEDRVHDAVEKGIVEAEFNPWQVSNELCAQIIMRLAPFHLEKMPAHGMPTRQLSVTAISRGSTPNYPLTRAFDVLQASKKPENVALIVRDVDDESAPPPLWLAATMGSGSQTYFEDMSQIEVIPKPVLMSQYRQSEIIKWGVSPHSSPVITPLRTTSSSVTSVVSTRARRFELPTIVVFGDTLEDFSLYHALFWLHGRSVWLPTWFTSDSERSLWSMMSVIREAESNGRLEHNQHLSFVSHSVPKDELATFKQKIEDRLYLTTVTIDEITPYGVSRWLKHPFRIYAEGHLGDVSTHLLFGENLPGLFESPLPRKLHPVNPLEHRWLVDIVFMEHLIPRHPALGQVSVYGPNVGEVRASGEAVTYQCPGAFVRGNLMETNILRPSIRVPDAESIFQIVLDDAGYRSAISDKGRYESATLQKSGGLAKAGETLRSRSFNDLLMKYRDKSDSADGEGVYLRSDQRRYLDFASINKIMQNDLASCNIIDTYVESGMLYRGYIFTCGNCSDSAWHSIANVDQTFSCSRCGLKQIYKHHHWKMPKEPLWYYKLDEMVYLMLENNGHVPVLTLDKLRLKSAESFLFCHDLRIFPGGSGKAHLEMDICCIPDGKLCIGESKSNGELSSKHASALQIAERYRDLALRIGASLVMFSTTAESWSEESAEGIDSAFSQYPQLEVLKWTASDLYL